VAVAAKFDPLQRRSHGAGLGSRHQAQRAHGRRGEVGTEQARALLSGVGGVVLVDVVVDKVLGRSGPGQVTPSAAGEKMVVQPELMMHVIARGGQVNTELRRRYNIPPRQGVTT
jgi:hypothetical protein